MLVKGIVEQVIDRYSVRVRIPIWDGIPNSSDSTQTDSLAIATICNQAGVHQALKPGEIVFIEQEQDDKNMPVVMGVLARDSATSSSNITAQALKVDVDVNLPQTFYALLDEYFSPKLLALQEQIDVLKEQLSENTNVE